MVTSSPRRVSPVHRQRDAGHEAGLVAGEVEDGGGDLVGLAEALERVLQEHGLTERRVVEQRARHRRLDHPRADAVDAHGRRPLHGHLAREVHHRALRRRVGGRERATDHAVDRREVHDGSVAARAERRQGGPRREIGAGQVGVHHALPFRGGGRAVAALGAYAGGVHEGGEGGEVRDHLVHHPLARRGVGDVGLQRERLAARRADHARRFLRALAEAIDARDARAPPPPALPPRAVPSARPPRRSPHATRPPSAATRRAVAAPMPEPAPVISATLPRILPAMTLLAAEDTIGCSTTPEGAIMDFEYSKKTKMYMEQLTDFMSKYIYPNEHVFHEQLDAGPTRWQIPPIMEELKDKARERGLWNLFLPESQRGAGLTNLDRKSVV